MNFKGDFVFADADQLFKVTSCQILPQKLESSYSIKKPVIPGNFTHLSFFIIFYVIIHIYVFILYKGSEVWMELQLDSHFPLDIPFNDISISIIQGLYFGT